MIVVLGMLKAALKKQLGEVNGQPATTKGHHVMALGVLDEMMQAVEGLKSETQEELSDIRAQLGDATEFWDKVESFVTSRKPQWEEMKRFLGSIATGGLLGPLKSVIDPISFLNPGNWPGWVKIAALVFGIRWLTTRGD